MLNVALTLPTQSTTLDLSCLRPVFLTFHFVGGIVGLPLLIITCLRSENIPFQPDLINFYIACVINSISYILLVFVRNVRNPPHLLCFIQATMIQGGPPMTALAIFLVIFKIWLTFRDPHNNLSQSGRISENACSIIFYSLPYILFVVLLLTSVGLQLRNTQSLSARNGLYCTAYGIPFRRVSVPALSIILLGLMIGFEVAIGVRFYRSRRRIASSFPLAPRNMAPGIIIRVTLFNAYLCITFGATITFLFGPTRSWPYMVQAALPLVVFVLFATQKVGPSSRLALISQTLMTGNLNVLLVWFFWVKPKKPVPSNTDGSIPTLRRAEGSDSQIDMSSFNAPSDIRTQS